MKIVLSKFKNDCEIPLVANATGKTYEQAKKAIGWQDLPGDLENPVFGNPVNIGLALIKLGFWKDELTITELLAGKAKSVKTCLLLKESPTKQHWVNWLGIDTNRNHLVLWGDSEIPRKLTPQELIDYLTEGKTFLTPNCAFTVYKANFFRLWSLRIKNFFSKES